jgi:hypothetical protein
MIGLKCQKKFGQDSVSGIVHTECPRVMRKLHNLFVIKDSYQLFLFSRR